MKVYANALVVAALCTSTAVGQITNSLPGRTLNKLLPDYLRACVYALNQGNGSVPGTLLALNSSNGTILNEISLNLNPTDMVITSAGDAIYVINAGSRTISKVDLTTFSVVTEEAISTPNTYSLSNPLHLAVGRPNLVYFTDGGWAPSITTFDYLNKTNIAVYDDGNGAGGITVTRNGSILYRWRQYGWGAGNVNSWVTRYDTVTNANLTPLEDSFTSWRRDPTDTPIFLDGAERWVFNKEQMFAATNVSVLLNQFSDNIYGISLDGSVAFGPTEVFNTLNGSVLTNLPFSTTVQTLSGDQKKLLRYNASASSLVIYDMTSIAPVSGPNIAPTPADGSVVSLPLTNLTWTVSPFALAYDVYFGTNRTLVAGATQISPLYLGRVTTLGRALSQALFPGATYYWRVDVVGFDSTNLGGLWSFTASTLSVNPAQITYSAITGYNPPAMTLSLTSSAPVVWTGAVTGSNWLVLNPTAGTSPSAPNITFNTAALPAGQYTNNMEFTIGALKLEVPVTINIKPLNISKMAADRQRPYLYALQPPALSGQDGLLLFINTTTGNIDNTLTIGINPTDLSINYAEGHLYIASWTETWTYVVDLTTQTLLPSLDLGTDIYKINAGRAGRVVTEGEDQWIAVNIVDTGTGAVVGSFPYPEREGDGEADPTGTVYYHCDNDISDAHVHKFIMTNDTPVEVADSNEHPFGTRNLVLSADGTQLFWNSYVYDTNLNELGSLGSEIYSCTSNARVAFAGSQAFDTTTLQAIYNLPAASAVSCVDGQNQYFWYFDSTTATLGSIPLSVIQSPTITQQPAPSTTVAAGSAVYLTVTGIGLSPLSYQWTLAGTNLPGATNYFLSINNIPTTEQGSYQVIISNSFGSVTSAVAQVTVLIPPAITSQPSIVAVLANSNATMTIGALGTPPMSYQWSFQGVAIANATNNTLTVSNAQSVNEGYYQVALANSIGTATSRPILLRVLPSAALIVSGPVPVSVPAGNQAVFNAGVIGSAPLTFQWYKNGDLLPGAVSSQLVISNAQAADAGTYQLLVSNFLGAVISAGATLTVVPAKPSFVLQPVPAAAVAGSSVAFESLAIGSDDDLNPIKYAWYFQSNSLTGQTGSNLFLASITAANQGAYYAVASNSCGTATSAVVQLTVYLPPSWQTGLSNEVVDEGTTIVLGANANGTTPLAYSWNFNATQLSNTAAFLSLTNIAPSQSGFYSVTVTNEYGSISSTCRVSVFVPPSQVVAWGDDSGGQTNVPANLDDAVAIAGGDYHSVAIRDDGTLIAWGFDDDGQTDVPTNSLPFVSIAAGADHNLAIVENGSVVAWGLDDSGQTNVPDTVSSVLSVAAGESHSVALLASGTVVAWGDDTYGQTFIPDILLPTNYVDTWWGEIEIINANWIPVQTIAAGRNHTLALLTNGTVVAWGDNGFGQASPPSNLSNVVAVTAGDLHSAALCSNGTVVVWGDDTFGQTNVPPSLSNVVAIAAGDFHTLALLSNGAVVGWGDDTFGQLDVPSSVTNAIAIASGYYHGLALVPYISLQAHLTPDGLVIQWNGSGNLQWAPTVTGPYADVLSQGNSWTNVDMSAPAKFFRLRR
jgi:alpha-tubulin suppressor-like RCC1 family protein